MATTRSMVRLFPVALFAACLSGCESAEAKAKRIDLARATAVHEAALAYANHVDSFIVGPGTAKDLEPYVGGANIAKESDAPERKRQLLSGDIAINPRLNRKQVYNKGYATSLLIVWEKDVATKGGFAAGFDTRAVRITAAEFAKAPKGDDVRMSESDAAAAKNSVGQIIDAGTGS